MTLARRFLVLTALIFWQGGFTFYAAVVVPTGAEVLGSHVRQGFITRRVSQSLNLAGAVALVPLAWDTLATRDRAAWRRRLRWAAWAVMAGILAFLVWLHGYLDALLDPGAFRALDADAYRPAHRVYLWTSSVQWGAAVVWAVLGLAAWRAEDRVESTV